MFQRPSSRRKTKTSVITLNLVPVLDAMVTLIAFLLFTMSFLAIVSIESPFPQTSSESVTHDLKEKPLQLTVTLHENDIEIWSPFDRIPSKQIPYIEGKPDLLALHRHLVEIKQQFPYESKIVFAPHPQTDYNTLIAIIDALRETETSDTPIFRKNTETGNDELIKMLFPDVIFGNLLGDA